MSLRSFTDSQGVEWQAFDVVPRDDERRRYDRRASGEIRAEDVDVERREEDRRLTVGRASEIIHRTTGWLCFEEGDHRRRLAPIPNDWMQCPDEALEQYCKLAKPVKPLTFAKK